MGVNWAGFGGDFRGFGGLVSGFGGTAIGVGHDGSQPKWQGTGVAFRFRWSIFMDAQDLQDF